MGIDNIHLLQEEPYMAEKKRTSRKKTQAAPQVDRQKTASSSAGSVKTDSPQPESQTAASAQQTETADPSPPVEQTKPKQSLYEQRQAELAAQREEHNRRTGDASRR